MATLKEIFGNKTRGDGRKVRSCNWVYNNEWFEPIFLAEGEWYGVDERGVQTNFPDGDEYDDFELVKITKIIRLYQPIFRDGEDKYCANLEWHTDKNKWSKLNGIKGWLEMEAEVEE